MSSGCKYGMDFRRFLENFDSNFFGWVGLITARNKAKIDHLWPLSFADWLAENGQDGYARLVRALIAPDQHQAYIEPQKVEWLCRQVAAYKFIQFARQGRWMMIGNEKYGRLLVSDTTPAKIKSFNEVEGELLPSRQARDVQQATPDEKQLLVNATLKKIVYFYANDWRWWRSQHKQTPQPQPEPETPR